MRKPSWTTGLAFAGWSSGPKCEPGIPDARCQGTTCQASGSLKQPHPCPGHLPHCHLLIHCILKVDSSVKQRQAWRDGPSAGIMAACAAVKAWCPCGWQGSGHLGFLTVLAGSWALNLDLYPDPGCCAVGCVSCSTLTTRLNSPFLCCRIGLSGQSSRAAESSSALFLFRAGSCDHTRAHVCTHTCMRAVLCSGSAVGSGHE